MKITYFLAIDTIYTKLKYWYFLAIDTIYTK